MSRNVDIARVYEEHGDELKGFISRRVSLKEDVEDILQNVFYNLAKIDTSESPIEQMTSWLYSVARNQIIDHYRKKKEEHLPEVPDDAAGDEIISDLLNILASNSDSPEVQYTQAIIWEELEAVLNDLPDEQRTVFELTELEGFSYKDIAESTGIPVNTLLSRKRYAILHLRERMQYLYIELLTE